MNEWQPIETAPKDCRRVILCGEDGHYVRVGEGYWSDSGWRWSTDSDWMDYAFNPTHWMRLPEPPTDKPKKTIDRMRNISGARSQAIASGFDTSGWPDDA